MNNSIEIIPLENGLTIYLYKDNTKQNVIVNLITLFGGCNGNFLLDGKPYTIPNGVAHLLEHLLIEKSKYGNLIHALGDLYMGRNGVTTTHYTKYFFDAVENVEKGIEILLHGINGAVFTEKDVEEIKPAILEEMRENQDNKFRTLWEMQNENLFWEIPYRSGIGTKEEVESITYEMVKACYEGFYRPQNQIIFVAGRFHKRKVVSKIKSCLKELPTKTSSFSILPYQEPLHVKKKKSIKKMPTGTDIARITYKIDTSSFSPEEKNKLSFYLSYFLRMNFDVTSPTYQQMIDEKITTNGIGFNTNDISSFILVSIYTYTEQKKRFIEIIQNVIQKKEYNQKLFKLYQRNERINIALRPEKLSHMIEPFLDNLLIYKYPYLDTPSFIENLSFSEFKKTIDRLDFSHFTVLYLEKE